MIISLLQLVAEEWDTATTAQSGAQANGRGAYNKEWRNIAEDLDKYISSSSFVKTEGARLTLTRV